MISSSSDFPPAHLNRFLNFSEDRVEEDIPLMINCYTASPVNCQVEGFCFNCHTLEEASLVRFDQYTYLYL